MAKETVIPKEMQLGKLTPMYYHINAITTADFSMVIIRINTKKFGLHIVIMPSKSLSLNYWDKTTLHTRDTCTLYMYMYIALFALA